MLKQEECGGCGGGSADSSYLSSSCDAQIHAATLCTTCDSNIVHTSNSVASRHQRVPFSPTPGILYGPPAVGRPISKFHHIIGHYYSEDYGFLDNQEEETTIDKVDAGNSWMLLNPSVKNHHQGNTSGMQFDGEVVDEYLDLGDYNDNNNNSSNQENQFNIDVNCNIDNSQHYEQHQQQQYNHGDSIVPAGAAQLTESNHDQLRIDQQLQTYPSASASTSFANQVVAVPCMDVVVPETAITDFSHSSQPRTPKGTIDPMDREARVLRYREKKKARKFEKTIRYASRKAYAETRPRIKGRFAKRLNVDDVEVDQVLSESTAGYCVVPSF